MLTKHIIKMWKMLFIAIETVHKILFLIGNCDICQTIVWEMNYIPFLKIFGTVFQTFPYPISNTIELVSKLEKKKLFFSCYNHLLALAHDFYHGSGS